MNEPLGIYLGERKVSTEEYFNKHPHEKSILCSGGLDFFLIEDATELLRQMIQNPKQNNIELLLMKLGQKFSSEYIFAHTYPFYIPHATEYDRELGASKHHTYKTLYYQYIDATQKEIQKLPSSVNRIFTIIGLDLKKQGGHYAALLWDSGQVYLFDSMQGRAEGYSAYTSFYRQVAFDIFGVEPKVEECVSPELSLQITGGFVPEPNDDETEREYLYRVQNTEAQNHFCYIWAIWYIHLRLIGYNVMKVLNSIYEKNINPLFVIKRYIYGMIHLSGLTKKIHNYEFFQLHFSRVWEMCGDEFFLFDLEFPPISYYKGDINNVLDYSITSHPIRVIPTTAYSRKMRWICEGKQFDSRLPKGKC
jgi:hypothetical protein